MAEYVIRVGRCSEQGLRKNNEDRYLVDPDHHLYMVADGMGGQDLGEQASGLATEIIPQIVQQKLEAHTDVVTAIQEAFAEANRQIIDAGRKQPSGHRKMGTTAVMALQQDDQLYVASLGDSRAYLIRGDQVEQLTVDHSVAQALVLKGILKPEEARQSRWSNMLHKFLGCVDMADGADIRPFTLEAGDRLLLGSDGLTNHASEEELRESVRRYPDPQECAEQLVRLALAHGSRDNVTCLVVAFEPE